MEINTKEMIKFYEEFDPVDFKYYNLLYNSGKKVPKYSDIYSQYEKHEYAHQFAELTKKNYGSVRANLDLVYARKDISDNAVKLYDLILHKLICRYINIDGIERMFSEKYADFEWEMHLGIDYRKHSMKFYRDHFIHQIRDAYMIHMLLQTGYENYVMEILEQEGNSKISRFVTKYLIQQMEIKEECGRYREKGKTDVKQKERIRKHYFRNIIYMASYMAALFHDIGYPDAAHISNRSRITEYISDIYHLEASVFDFSRIFGLLQNSLLFRVVSIEEIRRKIESKKPDHGALSAVIFLMHFYENGAIHNLQPYKLCAVELAGLAIYNHTAKYSYYGDEKPDAYRISFVLNPIAYLLRVCDDLQEWDRIYFEITHSSNLILCNRCKTPVLRGRTDEKVYYRCNCNSVSKRKANEDKGIFKPIFPYDAFPYRRIYNITVCQNLRMKMQREEHKILFSLDYNLGNLLHIAYINSSYAKYRIKELNKVKRLFELQDLIPRTYVEYFVTPNPLLIKTRIIHQWSCMKHAAELNLRWNSLINAEKKAKDRAELIQFFDAQSSNFADWLENEMRSIKSRCKTGVTDRKYLIKLDSYLSQALKVYGQLCWMMEMFERANCQPRGNEKILSALNGLGEILEKKVADSKTFHYSEDALCLFHDCILQMSRLYKDISCHDIYPSEYYRQFAEDEEYKHSLYESCASFTLPEKYIPINEQVGAKFEFDAFTDLCVFQELT